MKGTGTTGIRLMAVLGVSALLSLMPLVAHGASQDAAEPVTIDLNEVDDSGVSGTATVTAMDGQTHVEMTLEGPGVQGNHPTHIHTGTCSNFDPDPLIPLETFVLDPVDRTGTSTTTIDASLESLQSGDYVILVHLSPDALTTYLVCGEIPQAEAAQGGTTATVTPATEDHAAHGTPAAAVPGTGVGAALDEANTSLPIIGLAAAASVLALSAVAVRRQWR